MSARAIVSIGALIWATAAPAAPKDPAWSAVEKIFGRAGEEGDGYFRINLPRSDLRVSIGADVLQTPFELTSYVGFMPMGGGRVMAMGEVVLADREAQAALAEAAKSGVAVTAVHNHLIGESPRIVYVHVMADGPAEAVASSIRAVYAATATPLGKPAPEEKEDKSGGGWSAIDAVLGPHAEAEGKTAEYVFPRKEKLSMHGMSVKSSGMIETATEAVFQKLDGGKVACGGELFLLPAEVAKAMRALEQAGLHVTALHNHTLDESPRMYWMHWYGTGDGATLAKGVAAAIAATNSAQKSKSEEH